MASHQLPTPPAAAPWAPARAGIPLGNCSLRPVSSHLQCGNWLLPTPSPIVDTFLFWAFIFGSVLEGDFSVI